MITMLKYPTDAVMHAHAIYKHDFYHAVVYYANGYKDSSKVSVYDMPG